MDFWKLGLALAVWNEEFEQTPEADDSPSTGYKEFQDTRTSVRERFANEHRFSLTGGTGGHQQGWHRKGSAISYVQEDEPATRPDGTTDLNSDDNGRLWFKPSNSALRIYFNGSWLAVAQQPFELYTSTQEPTADDGKEGDFWFQYSED